MVPLMAGTRERKEARLKLFVEHYLTHGEATAAAVAAGYKGTRASLGTIGSRLLKEVEAAGLLEKARERVLSKVERATVATQTETLEALTAQMRREQPSKVVDGIRGEEKTFEPLKAALGLLTWYKPAEDAPPGGQHVHFHLPPDMAKELFRRKLRGELGAGA
jgi:hypothetical protein